jgi:hypothetical protein
MTMALRCLLVLVVICSGLGWLASCQEAPEPRSILERAIAAHGGGKNINKLRLGVLRGASTLDDSEITQEESFDLPKRWKRTTSGEFDGKKRVSYDLVTDGNHWQWELGGEARQVKQQPGAQPHFGVVTMLLTLKDEKATLSPLKEIKVDDRRAIGFRDSSGDTSGDYYFDKTTHLLVQTAFKWRPSPGKEFDSKAVFDDYKLVDGVKMPYRKKAYFKRDADGDYILIADFIITEVRILEKIEDAVFSLPEKK